MEYIMGCYAGGIYIGDRQKIMRSRYMKEGAKCRREKDL